MDSYIAAAPSSLISQLDFSLKTTAPYVTQRRSVRMYPSSASSFTQNGVRTCRITLASEGEWLDPSTLRFQMTVNNGDPVKGLMPTSASANCCWNRSAFWWEEPWWTTTCITTARQRPSKENWNPQNVSFLKEPWLLQAANSSEEARSQETSSSLTLCATRSPARFLQTRT